MGNGLTTFVEDLGKQYLESSNPNDIQAYECLRYLALCEEQNEQGKFLKVEEICQKLGISRTTLYRRQVEWSRTDTMATAREMLLTLKKEAILIETHRVLAKWGEVVDRVLEAALDANTSVKALAGLPSQA